MKTFPTSMAWRDLAATINEQGLRHQVKPVRIELDAPSWISNVISPKLVLRQDGLVLQLHVSNGLIAPSTYDMAVYICDIAGIELVESQYEQTLGRWDWINRANGEGSEISSDSREEAAFQAVRRHFDKADWLAEVENGDTDVGYVQWALSQAFERACECIELEVEVVDG